MDVLSVNGVPYTIVKLLGHGKGGYSNQDKQVLMVAFPQKEIVQIKALVHELDEHAFLIVCDAHDVLGEGFRTYDKNEL